MQQLPSASNADFAEEIGVADPEPAFSHHDLLCKDIYEKSSKGLERLGRFIQDRLGKRKGQTGRGTDTGIRLSPQSSGKTSKNAQTA